MTSHNHLLCFIAVTSFLIIFFSAATGQNQPVPEYWKLVLRWPAAFCDTPGFRCFKSILQKAFLIESVVGITRNSVVTCDVSKQPRVNGSEIDGYRRLLEKYWTNLDGDDFEYWQRQWQTYASCFGIDQHSYLGGGLLLKIALDKKIVDFGFNGVTFNGEQIFGTLIRQNIVPGLSYPESTLREKIYEKYGANLETYCNNDPKGINQLTKFKFCAHFKTDKFVLVPCPINKSFNCKSSVKFTP